MGDCLTHRTKDGDRWDLLALVYYGDPLHLGPLLRANPAHAAKATLEENLLLRVPIIAKADTAPKQTPLTAWR